MSFKDEAPSYQQTRIELLAKNATDPRNEQRAVDIVETLIESGYNTPSTLYAILARALTKVTSLTAPSGIPSEDTVLQHVATHGAMLKSVATILNGFSDENGIWDDDGQGGFFFTPYNPESEWDDEVELLSFDGEETTTVDFENDTVTVEGNGRAVVLAGTPEYEVRRLIAEHLGIPEDAIQELRKIA